MVFIHMSFNSNMAVRHSRFCLLLNLVSVHYTLQTTPGNVLCFDTVSGELEEVLFHALILSKYRLETYTEYSLNVSDFNIVSIK